MRLWHKDLIQVLPKKQLLGQWRECCAIAKHISSYGTPGHILVNKIMDYPMTHFYTYGLAVAAEMKIRGYKCNLEKFICYFTPHEMQLISMQDVFLAWHDDRYLKQCILNLQEKYDCSGLTLDEWKVILNYLSKTGKWKLTFNIKEIYDEKIISYYSL